jgi:hypothetical protein
MNHIKLPILLAASSISLAATPAPERDPPSVAACGANWRKLGDLTREQRVARIATCSAAAREARNPLPSNEVELTLRLSISLIDQRTDELMKQLGASNEKNSINSFTVRYGRAILGLGKTNEAAVLFKNALDRKLYDAAFPLADTFAKEGRQDELLALVKSFPEIVKATGLLRPEAQAMADEMLVHLIQSHNTPELEKAITELGARKTDLPEPALGHLQYVIARRYDNDREQRLKWARMAVGNRYEGVVESFNHGRYGNPYREEQILNDLDLLGFKTKGAIRFSDPDGGAAIREFKSRKYLSEGPGLTTWDIEALRLMVRSSTLWQFNVRLAGVGFVRSAGPVGTMVSTGWLAGDRCTIVTSAHGLQMNNLTEPFPFRFYNETIERRALPMYAGTTPARNAEGKFQEYESGRDWIISRIEPCADSKTEPLQLERVNETEWKPLLAGTVVNGVGVTADAEQLLSTKCPLEHDFGGHLETLDCAMAGMSGGPVLNGEPRDLAVRKVVGIITSGAYLSYNRRSGSSTSEITFAHALKRANEFNALVSTSPLAGASSAFGSKELRLKRIVEFTKLVGEGRAPPYFSLLPGSVQTAGAASNTQSASARWMEGRWCGSGPVFAVARSDGGWRISYGGSAVPATLNETDDFVALQVKQSATSLPGPLLAEMMGWPYPETKSITFLVRPFKEFLAFYIIQSIHLYEGKKENREIPIYKTLRRC